MLLAEADILEIIEMHIETVDLKREERDKGMKRKGREREGYQSASGVVGLAALALRALNATAPRAT